MDPVRPVASSYATGFVGLLPAILSHSISFCDSTHTEILISPCLLPTAIARSGSANSMSDPSELKTKTPPRRGFSADLPPPNKRGRKSTLEPVTCERVRNGRKSSRRLPAIRSEGFTRKLTLPTGTPRAISASRRASVHARHSSHDVPHAAVDDAPVRGVRHGRGHQSAFPLSAWRTAKPGFPPRSTFPR